MNKLHPKNPAHTKSRILLAALVMLLVGCSSPRPGGVQPGGGASSRDADLPLLEIYVPGSVLSDSAPVGTKIDPLLNPKTPAPGYVESDGVSRYCIPGGLDGSAELDNFINREHYYQLIQLGQKTALARHQWRFDMERLQRQRQIVDGLLQGRARMTPQRMEQLRKEYRAHRSWVQAVQKAIDENNTAMRNRLMQNSPKIPITFLHQLPGNVDDINRNAAVLAARDEVMTKLEKQYGQALLGMYDGALSKLSSIEPNRASIVTLNVFDSLLSNNIHTCMSRFPVSKEVLAANESLNKQYVPIAKDWIARTRNEFQGVAGVADSTAGLRYAFSRLYSTDTLKELAMADPVISEKFRSGFAKLAAVEEAARQERIRVAKAEALRKIEQQRAVYRSNAARNMPPTAEQVFEMYLNNTEEYSSKHFHRVVNHGDGRMEFFRYIPLANIDYKWSEDRFTLSGLSCVPIDKRQRCKFSVAHRSEEEQAFGFLPSKVSELSPHDFEKEFYWDDNGLQVRGKFGTEIYIQRIYGSGGQSGSDSSIGGDRNSPMSVLREQRERMDQFKSDAASSGRGWMGETNQQLKSQGY